MFFWRRIQVQTVKKRASEVSSIANSADAFGDTHVFALVFAGGGGGGGNV